MISGIDGANGSFLADLNQIENRMTQTNKQITSGTRVNQASDDPAAIANILDYQNQIDQITQVQTNLNLASNDASTADGALQNASSILDQLISLAAQGANATATASTRATMGQQVQQLEQQLVSVANTSIAGRYIFGGDDPSTEPYTFDWSSPDGVVQNNTSPATAVLTDASGNSIVPGMTAQQIFGSVFPAVYSLGQALLSNDSSGAANAAISLKTAAGQVEQATAYYGNTESWIQQANTTATARLTNLQQALSGLRDTDVAAAATQLTLDQSALEAALSAHASIDNKSLFSYLG